MADILNYQAFAEYIKNKKDVNAIIKSILTTYQAFTILNDDVKLDIVTVADFKNKLSQNGVNLDIETSNTEVHDISNNMMARLMSDVIIVLATQEHQKGKRYPLGDDNFLCLNVEYKGIKPVYEFDIHEHEDNGTRAELQPVVHFNKIISTIHNKQTDILEIYKSFFSDCKYTKPSYLWNILNVEKNRDFHTYFDNCLSKPKSDSKEDLLEYIKGINLAFEQVYNDMITSNTLKRSFMLNMKKNKKTNIKKISLSDINQEWLNLYIEKNNITDVFSDIDYEEALCSYINMFKHLFFKYK